MDKTLKEIIEVSKKLITFQTTEDKPQELKKCVDFAARYLKGNGLRVKKFCFKNVPSLVATLDDKKRQKILLNAHLDVVPADAGQFKPFVRGNRLFGRGAADMKTGAASNIVLMCGLAKLPKDRQPSIGLILACDEEIGGFNCTGKLVKKGFLADFTIALEPSNRGEIIVKEKGVCWLKVTARGKGAHGSRPWLGDNAILKAMKAYEAICKLFPQLAKKSEWKPTVTLGAIQGGDVFNRVPDKAEMKLDIRFTEKYTAEGIIAKAKRAVSGISGVSITAAEKSGLLSTPRNNKFVLALEKCASKHYGRKAKVTFEDGASDLRFYTDIRIPAAILALKGGNWHGRNEFVKINTIMPNYNALREFILSAAR